MPRQQKEMIRFLPSPDDQKVARPWRPLSGPLELIPKTRNSTVVEFHSAQLVTRILQFPHLVVRVHRPSGVKRLSIFPFSQQSYPPTLRVHRSDVTRWMKGLFLHRTCSRLTPCLHDPVLPIHEQASSKSVSRMDLIQTI